MKKLYKEKVRIQKMLNKPSKKIGGFFMNNF